jgi:integrase
LTRQRYQLVATKLKSLPVGMHSDGGGLFLQVTKGVGGELRRSWILRFRSPVTLKRREMGLGRWEVVDLAVARSLADEARRLVPQGIDPIEQRGQRKKQAAEAAARAITFKEAADRCLASKQAGWRSAKSVQGWKNTIDNYAAPIIGHLPVQNVDVGLVMKVLEPIWEQKPETARRLRIRLQQVLSWASARGFRTGPNPAIWGGHLENLLASPRKIRKVKHHSALPYVKVPQLMAELAKREGLSARALEITILNATRTSETINAKWSEFDLDAATWSIPAGRMKAGVAHRIPLSDASIKILRKLRRTNPDGDYVFASRGAPLSNMAMAMLLPHVLTEKVTVHGFRSTFRIWAAEQTSYAREIAEAALAHAVQSAVEAAYRRTDLFERRRELMREWADYCYRAGSSAPGKPAKTRLRVPPSTLAKKKAAASKSRAPARAGKSGPKSRRH